MVLTATFCRATFVTVVQPVLIARFTWEPYCICTRDGLAQHGGRLHLASSSPFFLEQCELFIFTPLYTLQVRSVKVPGGKAVPGILTGGHSSRDNKTNVMPGLGPNLELKEQ